MPFSIPSFSEVGRVAQSRGALSCAPHLWRGVRGLWLPNAGVQGATLFDWSGYAKHGTLTNMDPATDWVGGRYGHELDLDGVNDRVQCPWGENLIDRSVSFSFWFSADMVVNPGTSDPFYLGGIMDATSTGGPGNASDHAIWFDYSGNSTRRVQVYIRGVSSYVNCTPIADNDGVRHWYHFAFAYSDASKKWTSWWNGEEYTTQTGLSDWTAIAWDYFQLGVAYRGYGKFRLSNLAIWTDRYLTDADVRQLYTDPHCMTRLDRNRLGVFRAAAAQNRRLLKRILASELYVGGAL
jgi:hypothetical protein